MTNLLRTTRDGCYAQRVGPCGALWVKVDDPEATADEAPKGFTLREDFPKLDMPNWQRVMSLYYHFLETGREVAVILLRDEATMTRWRVMVPRQKTDSVSCSCDLTELRDLETGEFTPGIPSGWFHAGSSHSHHSMGPTPSSMDDLNELSVPGLHLIAGRMSPKRYEVYSSVVSGKVRYKVESDAVLDATPKRHNHHPDVMQMVSEKERPPVTGVRFWKDDPLPGSSVVLSGYHSRVTRETRPKFEPSADISPKDQKRMRDVLATVARMSPAARCDLRLEMWRQDSDLRLGGD